MLPKKIAVIGIGNTLRRDDGIGIIVLESLVKFYKREGLAYLNFGSAGFDLLHRIKLYDKVLFIDGINSGLAPGQLKIGKLEDIEYTMDTPLTSTHGLNLKSIFDMSGQLGIKTTIYVAGIQVKDIAFAEGLSEALNNKKEDIVKNISAFIDANFI